MCIFLELKTPKEFGITSGKNKSFNINWINTDKGDSSESKEIVNVINDYFANVSPNIAERIKTVGKDVVENVENLWFQF